MANTIKIKRGTRAAIESAASGGSLYQSELYHDTTNNLLLLGTGTSTYQEVGPPSTIGWFSSFQSISTNTNASSGVLYILTATLTMTLPGSPSVGDIVGILNRSDSITSTVGRNGNKIMGLEEDMTIDVANGGFYLFYSGATDGWILL